MKIIKIIKSLRRRNKVGSLNCKKKIKLLLIKIYNSYSFVKFSKENMIENRIKE